MPALLTRMLIGPNTAPARATTSAAPLNLLTSHTTAPACGPMAAAASLRTAARRPAKTTLAPAEAICRAMARPRPVPPLVIKATSPARRKGLSILEVIGGRLIGLALCLLTALSTQAFRLCRQVELAGLAP